MRNKLVSLILVLCVILSVAPTFAAYNDIAGIKSEYDIRVLEGLGIADSDDTYRPESYITRGDFFLMTARLMGYRTESADEAVSYLASLGIISGYGNGEFKCDSPITYNEAFKMLVVALGYGQDAVTKGGWPVGYITIASNLKLFEASDKIDADGYVTRGVAATLIVRAGNTETVKHTVSDGSIILEDLGGKTLFFESLGVSKIRGIINANSATSLDNPSGVGLNEVKIGTEYIDAGNTNAKEYLGYYVDAYCVEDVGYKALVVVPVKEKNNVLRLASTSNITATGSYPSKIEINYYNNDGRQRHVKAENCDVIYNGAAYLGFSLADISIDSGEVVLLDNNSDGIYDVIFINEYETYVVKNINKDTLDIFDVYGRNLDLDVDSDQVQIIGSNGVYTDTEGIFVDDILSVQKSRNGQVVKVQIVKKSVSGKVEAINTTDGRTKLRINGTNYYVDKEFDTIVHPDKVDYYPGLEAVFHLDAEGKIVHITTGTTSGWKYGYILSAVVSDEDDDKIYFRLYTEANAFERFEVVEKVNVDGANKKVAALTGADSAWMSRQLIRYQAEGNVLKKIDTEVRGTNETDDSLSKVGGINNAKYASTPKIFYNGNETLLAGTNDTVVFTIPSSSSYYNDKMYYQVGGMSWFTNESTYNNLDAFNVNDAGVAEVIVRNQNDGVGIGKAHSSFVFVESVSTVLNEDGEPVQQLKGIRQSGSAVTLKTDKNDVIDTSVIGLGDVVRIREKNGSVVYTEKTVDFDTAYPNIFAYTSDTSNDSYYESLKIACGYLSYADDTHIVLTNDSENKNITFFLGTSPIMLCDMEEKEVKSISAANLGGYIKSVNPDAKAYVITKNGGVTAVMIRNS